MAYTFGLFVTSSVISKLHILGDMDPTTVKYTEHRDKDVIFTDFLPFKNLVNYLST